MREELHVAKVERREDHIVQRGVDSSVGDAVQREVWFEPHSSSVTVERAALSHNKISQRMPSLIGCPKHY